MVGLPSNRLRNLSTCNGSTQTLRNNIQESQLPCKAHHFYCACGCTQQLEILPWSLSMTQVIKKKRGKKKSGWFKVGRSIIISRNQTCYNQNGVREPKKWAIIIYNSCKAFVHRRSPRNPHKPTTSLALSEPPLGVELYSCIYILLLIYLLESGRANFHGWFQVLSVG